MLRVILYTVAKTQRKLGRNSILLLIKAKKPFEFARKELFASTLVFCGDRSWKRVEVCVSA